MPASAMNEAAAPLSDIKTVSKRMAQRALDMGENRLQLLLLEVEEERERLLQAMLVALGVAAFGLLAGVALTISVLLLFWNWSPLLAMASLTIIYAAIALCFLMRLTRLRREWEAFSGSLSQLREDCSCLAEILR
jgi:uncharacterized membrane protein YqjE